MGNEHATYHVIDHQPLEPINFESWRSPDKRVGKGWSHESQWIGSNRITVKLHLTGKSCLIF